MKNEIKIAQIKRKALFSFILNFACALWLIFSSIFSAFITPMLYKPLFVPVLFTFALICAGAYAGSIFFGIHSAQDIDEKDIARYETITALLALTPFLLFLLPYVFLGVFTLKGAEL